MAYEPIKFVKMLSGAGVPPLMHVPEAATQTFKVGVPLELASGYLQEADFDGADKVYGISVSPGQNLAVAGARQDLSEGAPINQSSAVTTPVGAWMREGKTIVYPVHGNYVFSVMLQSDDVFTQALVSATRYALTKDGTTGLWFVDTDDSGTNDEHAVNIIGVDPASPNVAGNARVWVVFNSAVRYFA